MERRTIVHAVALAAVAALGWSGPAAGSQVSGCEPIEASIRLDDVTAAFTGEVVAVEDRSSAPPTIDVEFAVDRVYKGDVAEAVSVRSAAPGSPYARAGTEPWTGAAPAELGKGTPPIPMPTSVVPPATIVVEPDTDEVGAADDGESGPLLPIWPTVAVGAGLAVVVALVTRHWERRSRT